MWAELAGPGISLVAIDGQEVIAAEPAFPGPFNKTGKLAHCLMNAALFPQVAVVMYGVELTAWQVPLLYLFFDALSASGRRGDVDVSAHAGGAAAGWLLASRWRPWWLL